MKQYDDTRVWLPVAVQINRCQKHRKSQDCFSGLSVAGVAKTENSVYIL